MINQSMLAQMARQAMQMMQSQINNPMMSNFLNMANNNDVNGVEQFARNMAREKGLDFDAEFQKFKNQLHF